MDVVNQVSVEGREWYLCLNDTLEREMFEISK
jgi:hypothetical protein